MHDLPADEPLLTLSERTAINTGEWFSSLSPALRHDILRHACVRRYPSGQIICARGDPAHDWSGVARGAVRISGGNASGKLVTLSYVEPGAWIGDVAIFAGGRRTHDAHAHGDTTLVTVTQPDLRVILQRHVELYDALLRLHAQRICHLFRVVEDLNILPLRTRLARQITRLARAYGRPSPAHGQEISIGLQLAQEELAQLLGASRQRVNQELKLMEREETIRIRPGSLVVRNPQALSSMLEEA